MSRAQVRGHEVPSHKIIKTPEQIQGIRESGKLNVAVLDYVAERIRAGITTADAFTARELLEESPGHTAEIITNARLACSSTPIGLRTGSAYCRNRQRM